MDLLINLLILGNHKPLEFYLTMATKTIQEIKDNYDFYNNLLQQRKSIFSSIIDIKEIGNNNNTLEKIESIKHIGIEDPMFLIVDVKLNNHNFFQFKLRYKEFIEQPFFRYDSDGDAHRNKIQGIPLQQQRITTPHFHKFDKNGIEIAYKTDQLLDERECKALEDINLCIAHFCHEANIRFEEEDFPQVVIGSNTLGLTFEANDPNSNIDFI